MTEDRPVPARSHGAAGTQASGHGAAGTQASGHGAAGTQASGHGASGTMVYRFGVVGNQGKIAQLELSTPAVVGRHRRGPDH